MESISMEESGISISVGANILLRKQQTVTQCVERQAAPLELCWFGDNARLVVVKDVRHFASDYQIRNGTLIFLCGI